MKKKRNFKIIVGILGTIVIVAIVIGMICIRKSKGNVLDTIVSDATKKESILNDAKNDI